MKALKSRTVWKAIVVAIVGIGTAVLTEYDLIGYIAILNAVADVALRVVTTTSLQEK